MSISSRITEMEQHIGNAYDKIEDLGIDLTNVDKNIDNISSMLENVWNEYPKVTATDVEEATLNGTKKGRMEIDLKGQTSQETLTGKNLLSNTLYEMGINASDGKIIVASGRNARYCEVTGGTTYYISRTGAGTASYYYYGFYNEEPSDNLSPSNSNSFGNIGNTNPKIVTAPSTAKYLVIFTGTGVNENQMISTTSDLTFEPYCGGIPAPNPSYEIPVKNVTGDVVNKIQNKNLVWDGWAEDLVNRINDIYKATIISYDNRRCLKISKDVSYPLSATNYLFKTDFKLNTQYTVSFDCYTSYSLGTNLNLSLINDKNSSISPTLSIPNKTWTKVTITNTSETTISSLAGRYRSEGYTYIDLDTFQIEEGSTATSYVPHQEQNLPFTFESGQRAMQGTTLEDDGINNNRNQVVFDGTENWQIFDLSSTKKQFYLNISTVKHNETTPTVKSNYFIADVIGNRYSNNNVVFSTSNGVAFVTTTMLTLADWKTWVAQKYSNNQPLIAEYNLKEPEIIPYTQTQQTQYNAIKQARSYNDQTNISSTSDELGFNMNVESLGNINTVINNLLNN